MIAPKFFTLSFIFFVAFLNSVEAQDSGFRFLATGDVPYSKQQDVDYRRLLDQAKGENFAFLMHVGDFKAQSVPCSDAEFEKIRDLFRAYPTPVVYTPGDNEWTDCRGDGVDPLERLDKLRELFFKDKTVLRLDQLDAQHQNRDPQFALLAPGTLAMCTGISGEERSPPDCTLWQRPGAVPYGAPVQETAEIRAYAVVAGSSRPRKPTVTVGN